MTDLDRLHAIALAQESRRYVSFPRKCGLTYAKCATLVGEIGVDGPSLIFAIVPSYNYISSILPAIFDILKEQDVSYEYTVYNSSLAANNKTVKFVLKEKFQRESLGHGDYSILTFG